MKKLISLILAFAMVFTLAMPALAADGDVTANYTPVIAISDVTISEHTDYPGVVAVDETNKTYTITIPADQTEVIININVSGQNLDKLPNDGSYLLDWKTSAYSQLSSIYYNEENGNLEYGSHVRASNVGSCALKYSTDGGTTWTDTGWNVVIQKAAPIAVYLNVKLKAVDSTGAEITGDLIGYVNNSGVDNRNVAGKTLLPGDYPLTFAGGAVPSGYQTPADVSLTVTDDGVLTSNSSHATVELVDGVYVITVTLAEATIEPEPATATITGVSLSGTGVTYDETTKTYTVAHDATNIVLTVTGTNLQNGTEDNVVSYANGNSVPVVSRFFTFSGDGTTETSMMLHVSHFVNSSNYEIKYSNDGQQSWTNTGIYVTYDAGVSEDEKAEITDVSITVDGTEYTSGNVTITPTSTVTLTVTGTNLQNGTHNNYVEYAYGWSMPVTGDYFDFSGDGTTATSKNSYISASAFVNCSNFEIEYTNDGGQRRTNTGIYVTYDAGVSEDEKAEITGVKITVDGTEYTSGSVTITPTSTVTLTVTGTNLQNGTHNNYVDYAHGIRVHVTSDYFDFNGDGTTATLYSYYISASNFVNCSNFEIEYSNDGQQSWTNTGIYVTYDDGSTEVTYDVNIAEVENGTVTADKSTAAEGDTVTLTVTPNADYQIGTVTVKDAEGSTVAFTETGVASGTYTFTMPASEVTVEATFTAIEKTSADISWGSLAYTYTDEAGKWSAGTAEGAGTVTVTNTGTTDITAAPAYEATTTDYGNITGSFDAASADLAANASKTFTLSLNGTPTKAIPAGTKIGTVTVTITVEVPVSPDWDEEW